MDKLKKLLVSFVMLSLLTLSPTSAQAVATSMDDVAEAIKDEYQEIVLGTAKEYKDSDYEIIKYEDIMRERNGMTDVQHTFYATVQQYDEAEDLDMAYGLVMRNDDLDTAYFVFFPTLPDSRLMDGDDIDLYGTLHRLYTYETVMGGTKTVPVLLVHKVLVEGIDY